MFLSSFITTSPGHIGLDDWQYDGTESVHKLKDPQLLKVASITNPQSAPEEIFPIGNMIKTTKTSKFSFKQILSLLSMLSHQYTTSCEKKEDEEELNRMVSCR